MWFCSWLTASVVLLPISRSFTFTSHTSSFTARKSTSQSRTIFYGSSNENSINENGNSVANLEDHAPCFDSVCITSPWNEGSDESDETTAVASQGEAISRLGSMAGPTVWSEFNRLSQEHPGVANLGQGFPDWLPPKFALDSLMEAVMDSTKSPHQYTRTAGHPNLVKGLAKRYSIHLDRDLDPMAEVAVTVGASQALYLSLQTIIKPGDEVILFEPFFDLYVNQIKLAGGKPVYVPLTFVPYDENADISGGEWILESQKLEDAITPNTRAIILNSPHNPTGKVFTRGELESMASIITNKASPNCVVLSDEVYKYIVHSPPLEEVMINANGNISSATSSPNTAAITCPGHVQFASLPNMYDRTITISSAGKTFSATGWQVGWCVGPQHLITPIHQLLPYVQFCASTVIQEALARTLPQADKPYKGHTNYYEYLKTTYTRKRDTLSAALTRAGFGVPDFDVTPGGGFFIFARISKGIADAVPLERRWAKHPASPGGVIRPDWALCLWMAEEKGVLCIPSSPFFSRERVAEGASDDFVRVAFCKTDETIAKAAQSLSELKACGEREKTKINLTEASGNSKSETKQS